MPFDSWSIRTWPESVWPHRPMTARNLIAKNRASLMSAGVLSRVGRQLIIDGPRYQKWIRGHASRVDGFDTKGAEAMRERWARLKSEKNHTEEEL